VRKLGQPQDLPSAAVNAALAACEKVGVTGDMRRAGRGELLHQGHALKAKREMLQLITRVASQRLQGDFLRSDSIANARAGRGRAAWPSPKGFGKCPWQWSRWATTVGGTQLGVIRPSPMPSEQMDSETTSASVHLSIHLPFIFTNLGKPKTVAQHEPSWRIACWSWGSNLLYSTGQSLASGKACEEEEEEDKKEEEEKEADKGGDKA